MGRPATLRHRERRERKLFRLIGESVPDLAGEYADVTKVHHNPTESSHTAESYSVFVPR